MTIQTSTAAVVTSIGNYGDAINKKKLNSIGGKIAGYVENALPIAANAATFTLNAALSNIFNVSLSVASSKLAFSNVPVPDAVNANYKSYSVTILVKRTIANAVIDWSGLSITWQDNTAPDQTAAVGKTDIYVLATQDGGTTWNGFVSGTNR